MPTIIGYIVTGIAITQLLNIQKEINEKEVQHIAEFGVVFLMFTIGLEFSLKHLQKMQKEVFLFGTMQVLITTTFIYMLLTYFFNIPTKTAIIIGTIFSLSSTAIILKIFNENGETNTTYGKNIVGILIFQDLAVIPILLMITIFSSENTNLNTLFTQTILGAILLLGCMWFIARYLLEHLFKLTIQSESQEIFLGLIFLIVIGASFLSHYFGFSYSLGAFIAGMIIAETHYKHQVENDLIPFRELLLGMFFITVGMQIDLEQIFSTKENIFKIITILLSIMTIKAIIISTILINQKKQTKIKSAIALFGLGEFGLVIADLSKTNNLIDSPTYQTITATIILSLIITPFTISNLKKITNLFNKQEPNNHEFKNIKEHTIIIGYGEIGKEIAKILNLNQSPYVIIEGNSEKAEQAKKENQPLIIGNASQTDILQQANINKASFVFITIENNRKIPTLCKAVRENNEKIKIITKAHNQDEKKTLYELYQPDIDIILESKEMANLMVEKTTIG